MAVRVTTASGEIPQSRIRPAISSILSTTAPPTSTSGRTTDSSLSAETPRIRLFVTKSLVSYGRDTQRRRPWRSTGRRRGPRGRPGSPAGPSAVTTSPTPRQVSKHRCRSWSSGARGSKARRRSGRLIEDRPEDSVRFPDVLGPPAAGDEREDLFGVLARHRGRPVGPHVRQLSPRDLERDRHPVQAVDGDRLLAALDLADELAGQAGEIAQPLLAESALLAERPQPLPQECSYVFHRAFAHGPVRLREPHRNPA